MKNLNFLQDDKQFIALLKKQRETVGEHSIIPELERVLKRNNIKLKDLFFLKSYLLEFKCPNLNDEFIELFDKAIYLNEKTALLEYLVCNDYSKKHLREIINSELLREYTECPPEELELYKYDLNEILRQLKKESNL